MREEGSNWQEAEILKRKIAQYCVMDTDSIYIYDVPIKPF